MASLHARTTAGHEVDHQRDNSENKNKKGKWHDFNRSKSEQQDYSGMLGRALVHLLVYLPVS
jgi:hypothetical protein